MIHKEAFEKDLKANSTVAYMSNRSTHEVLSFSGRKQYAEYITSNPEFY